MNRVPRIEKIGDGTFRVDGLFFHMPGKWRYFDVARGPLVERRRWRSTWNDRASVLFLLVQIGRVDPPVAFDAATVANPDALPAQEAAAGSDEQVRRRPDAARFGKRLFFDKRCPRTARSPARRATIRRRRSATGRLGEGMGKGTRHVPTLLNAAFQRWSFWDGRADSMWSQALHPLERERMGGSAGRSRPSSRATRSSAGTRSSSARCRTLPVPRPRGRLANTGRRSKRTSACSWQRLGFDRFVAALREHDVEAQKQYPESALRGLVLFEGRANCRLCHAGPLFSDGEFHNIGVPTLDKSPPRDPGRREGIQKLSRDPFNAAGMFSDDPRGPRAQEMTQLSSNAETWGQFRTPSLRNVARTAPYMHQGQFATLDDVLHYYSTLEGSVPAGHHGEQVIQPLHLTDVEIADLLAFLETLNGQTRREPARSARRPAPRLLLRGGAPIHADRDADRDVHRAALLIGAPHGDETAMRADVRAAKEALLRRGFRPEEITTPEACPDPKTFRNALASLESRISDWSSGSVFLYFSGHGTVHGSTLTLADPAILLEKGEVSWSDVMFEFARWRRIRFTLFADC